MTGPVPAATPEFKTARTQPRFIDARRYDTGEAVRLAIVASRIASVRPLWPSGPLDELPFVAPGLFDLQVNGYGGVWFADRNLTPLQATTAITAYLAHGVTRLCPTLITSSFEMLRQGFEAIRQACESEPVVNHMVAGFHLEGPYLSAEDGPRGAHPRAHIRAADWSEFCELQKVSGNRIRLVTIAPEALHALEFIRRAIDSGVCIAIGHTAATGDQIRAAVDAGATLSTHLGNGTHPVLRRHPNSIWEQLGEPRLAASLIVDGHHLPDSVVRSMVGAKTFAGIILTCDASGWAGCSPGTYENELGKVEVKPGGRIVVAGQDQILAGSGWTTEMCVAQAVSCGSAGLREAIDMASRNPARLLGFREQRLTTGDPADLWVFRHRDAGSPIEVLATILAGETRFCSLTTT
ncbi:MAG: N-acetylglucosamine-6-phosphate deacetylase [Planctomycetaceae bacterium]|nr:N-acetylglucosamine-6-phosphate deacetylase [Planctomycetaceae bacterium]